MSVDLQKLLNSYEFVEKLPGSKLQVKIKPITTAQMKHLISITSMPDADAEKAIDELISQCVLTEGFNINDLYIEDRFYLLVALRKRTKGNMYRFQYTCPKCKAVSMQAIDLSKMKVTQLNLLNNVKKLDDNFTVQLKYFTRGVQLKALELNKVDVINPEDAAQQMNTMLAMYALCIEKIITPAGEITPTYEEALNFINALPDGLTDEIKQWFRDVNFGVEFQFKMKCDLCKKEEKVEVPLQGFLF